MRTFRIRYLRLGGHIHTRIFSAENPGGTFAKLGDLVMDVHDWESFKAQIGNGWQILPDEDLQQRIQAEP